MSLYYRYSPPLADFMRQNDGLRTVTRFLVASVVYAVHYPTIGMLATLLFGVRVYRRVTGRSRKFD